MDPVGYLRASDTIERVAYLRAIEAGAKARERLDRRLAQMVIVELSDALKRGQRVR